MTSHRWVWAEVVRSCSSTEGTHGVVAISSPRVSTRQAVAIDGERVREGRRAAGRPAYTTQYTRPPQSANAAAASRPQAVVHFLLYLIRK
ncbi:hypothetical protein RB195_006575 [Necator americanus]|uniref:Secreted protein n=1 Tax=Necator americanus TaxID=51031 RepID=A0ABR1BW58_NECAM